MKRQRFLAALRLLASTMLLVTLPAAALIAQEEETGPKDQSSWVLGYALVGLGIVLGLVAVCRPGNRSSEVRVDED